jgi:hypothetical protein
MTTNTNPARSPSTQGPSEWEPGGPAQPGPGAAATRLICDTCRRPIWAEPDLEGGVVYWHVDASFDLPELPHSHPAKLYVPARIFMSTVDSTVAADRR